jgi:hypothetical protein
MVGHSLRLCVPTDLPVAGAAGLVAPPRGEMLAR